jgi:lipopolysaccharide biosynthesis glycosyltransferase
MMNGFCIILSKYRLYQGITLYRSLVYNYKNFEVFILCVDDETYQMCMALDLKNVILLKTEELADGRLSVIKQSRRLNEYCWTLKPFFLEHVLNKYDYLDNVVYLDADLCFFSDPSPIFECNKNYCALLSEHDFLEKNSSVEKNCGKYNSGFIVFKKCKTSLDVLKWWEEKCIDWCFDSVDEGKFGDQKYLDLMPHLFEGIYSITAPGVNIAPWNEGKYYFHNKGDKVYVNEDKLICYHFCGLRLLDKNQYALLIGSQNPNTVIHTPYTLVVQEAISEIERIAPSFNGYFVESHFHNKAKIYNIGK